MKCVIYYFSGTGNNVAIAKQLAEELGETDVFPMKKLETDKCIPEEYDWVVFTAPTYYSHVPPYVLQCMDGVVYTKEQKVVLIAGCGGNRGLTVADMEEKLEASGKKASQEYMVWLAGNYILSYGAFPKWYCNMLRRKAYRTTRKIARNMKEGRQDIQLKREGTFYKDKYEERLQRTIAGYPEVAKGYSISEACIGCGICAKVCPTGNIEIQDGKVIVGDHCNQCMACIQWCPKRAIDYEGKAAKRKRYHHLDVTVKDMFLD